MRWRVRLKDRGEGARCCSRFSVARSFVRDIPNTNKADAIAARQLHALREHYSGKLRFTDVKAMFVQMKDPAS
jgi:hypothetical protein